MDAIKTPVSLSLFFICAAVYFVFPLELQYYMALYMYPDISNVGLVDLLRLITHQFVHGSIGHFMGNFSIGLPAAIYIEKHIGSKNTLITWVVSGIGAGLVFMLAFRNADYYVYYSDADMIGPMVGASGAVFGVLVFALVLYAKTWLRAIVAYGFLLYFVVPQIIMGVISSYLDVSTAYWAHLGGGVVGLLCGYYFKPVNNSSPDGCDSSRSVGTTPGAKNERSGKSAERRAKKPDKSKGKKK